MIDFKYLCEYLPYDVKVQYKDLPEYGGKYMYSTLDTHIVSKRKSMFDNLKLCLRPMSDIEKEISHNGEKFVPKKKMYELWLKGESHTYEAFEWLWDKNHPLENFPHWMIQKLIEWHFDVYGLIKINQAIDLNKRH